MTHLWFVEKLVREGSEYVRELSKIDTSEYIRKYVLHSDDSRPVDCAASFLDKLIFNQMSQ